MPPSPFSTGERTVRLRSRKSCYRGCGRGSPLRASWAVAAGPAVSVACCFWPFSSGGSFCGPDEEQDQHRKEDVEGPHANHLRVKASTIAAGRARAYGSQAQVTRVAIVQVHLRYRQPASPRLPFGTPPASLAPAAPRDAPRCPPLPISARPPLLGGLAVLTLSPKVRTPMTDNLTSEAGLLEERTRLSSELEDIARRNGGVDNLDAWPPRTPGSLPCGTGSRTDGAATSAPSRRPASRSSTSSTRCATATSARCSIPPGRRHEPPPSPRHRSVAGRAGHDPHGRSRPRRGRAF